LSFYYIRNDHLQGLRGGIAALASYALFGPYPQGSTVKARKGAIYIFAWSCATELRSISISISDDPNGQGVDLICA
jgi:hypothetical protein